MLESPSVPLVNRRVFISVCALLLGVPSRPRRAARELPSLVWHSIETKHFRITYYSGEKPVAEHIADLCEDIYGRLEPAIGWPPSERTEIILTDETDTANGSASVLPYNAITPLRHRARRFLAARRRRRLVPRARHARVHAHPPHRSHPRPPRDREPHLGKKFAPNQVAPRWLLEGLAVYEESSKTSGGRLRSSMWNMWMRADILENNVAPLDVMSNSDSIAAGPRATSSTCTARIYGWIAETYGEQAIRAFIDDYGWQMIPFAINRSMRRATGRTFEELYPAWIETLKREFERAGRRRSARAGFGRGCGSRIRGSSRSTRAGFRRGPGRGPRGTSSTTWTTGTRAPVSTDCRWCGTRRGTSSAHVRTERELLVRTSGTATPDFAPDGSLVFNSTDRRRTSSSSTTSSPSLAG